MKKGSVKVAVLAAFCAVLNSLIAGPTEKKLSLLLVEQHPEPVITVKSAGAEGIKYGFEGGRVLKLGKTYHLFTSEMVGDPFWVKMKLGYWTSDDRIHWKRVTTLFESSGEYEGKDPRAALWSPIPVYDEKESRWNLFYVAYRSAPNTETKWLNNHGGSIWRAESRVPGEQGIAGPYEDVGVILEPGPDSDPWEGLQGTDSFFPYQVADRWYAFYGSARTESMPIKAWQVGLAVAAELAGPWKRQSEMNPLGIEPVFIENPIVTKLEDGTYLAVYDSHTPDAIGFTCSLDGVHWAAGQAVVVQPRGKGHWADNVRTPMGLIPEGNDTFTVFYTGYENVVSQFPDTSQPGSGSIGLVTLKLERIRRE